MTKILFVCHGNICRSPMAEFVLKDMVRRTGQADRFLIESAATTSEELGNPVYPPARRMLASHGISCEGKYARKFQRSDYDAFDMLIGMDEENMYDLMHRFGGDPQGKIHNLLDFAGMPGKEIADPWYTGDFQSTWDDLQIGCIALLNALNGEKPVRLDFSSCRSNEELFTVLREGMLWDASYGSNLDALHDILTGLPHYGKRFILIPPEEPEAKTFFGRIEQVFAEAGALREEEKQKRTGF